jgi:murein DD-endopeptidase MepM/ murein hydrolase activator NlpD
VVGRATLLLGAVAVLVLTGSSGVSSALGSGTSSAEAFAIQVSVPGRGGSIAGAVSGPPDAVGVGGAFAYPADGSIVQAASVSSSVEADSGVASASVSVSGLSIFGGEITVSSVTVKANARASAKSATGGSAGSAVSGMVVAGQAVGTGPNSSVPLGDWGTATVLTGSGSAYRSRTARGYNTGVTGLQIHVNVEHAGVPAGTDIVVGYADVAAEAVPPQPQERPGDETQRRIKPKVNRSTTPERAARPKVPLVRNVPTDVIPRLTASGYVFPVYGPAAFSNTFNAPRGAYVGGWHHGEDIFAPLGAPILAVANGVVYSVGWNKVGGLRFWLQDLAGNEFYYAHLSAFSPLAINGAQVRAGDVIGFVGNTGDAEHTPPHLHFEIHPVSLLYRGYDGSAVPPYPYLMAWKRLTDLPFTAVSGWAPPFSDSSRAPKPGAILLQTRDISSASGLEPGSLQRAMRAEGGSGADGSLRAMEARGRASLRALARALGGPSP